MNRVVSYRSAEAPLELATKMVALSQRVWPRDAAPIEEAREGIQWARAYDGPPEQTPMCYAILDAYGEPEAIAYTFAREIDTSAGRMTILALAGVAVDESKRGRGLGRTIVTASFKRVDQGVFPFSLFQTELHNRDFYEKLGAACVDNRVVNSLSPNGPDAPGFWDPLVVVYPSGGDWPGGVIDLRGPGY